MNSFLPATIGIIAFAAGQWLVTRRHWGGFLIWATSNYCFAAKFLAEGNHSTACMFLVYCAANVYSMGLWSRRSRITGKAHG